MNENLKIVSAYKGMIKYVEAVQTADGSDYEKAWNEFVINPFWDEWAAGQFNEQLMREEIKNPITDIDKLMYSIETLLLCDIESFIEKFFKKIFYLLPSPESDRVVCIYIDTRLSENLHGVVGSCAGDNILLRINPLIEGWRDYIPWVLAHEYHHTVWGYNYFYIKGNRNMDLLCSIINEGQADSFAKVLCTSLSPHWTRALSKEQELDEWHKLRSYLDNENSRELHIRFFFGDDKTNTPAFVGYTIGFNIVQEYLKNNPGTGFGELIEKDPWKLLEESGYGAQKYNGQ